MKLLRDLFMGVSNSGWELARVLAAWAVFSFSGAFIAAAARGQQIDFSALGVGFAAVLAGAGGLIWAKDTARAKAIAAETVNSGESA